MASPRHKKRHFGYHFKILCFCFSAYANTHGIVLWLCLQLQLITEVIMTAKYLKYINISSQQYQHFTGRKAQKEGK